MDSDQHLVYRKFGRIDDRLKRNCMRIIFDRNNFNRNLILPLFLFFPPQNCRGKYPETAKKINLRPRKYVTRHAANVYTFFDVNLRKARDINKLLNSNINTIFQYILLFETKETSICTWMYKIVSVKSFREEESS